MNKSLLFCVVLLVAVFCSACVNNVAIQELNNKAMEYLKNGDAQSAVCRLKSSLDLDNKFFETNYNLAIAYKKLEKNKKAQKMLDIYKTAVEEKYRFFSFGDAMFIE